VPKRADLTTRDRAIILAFAAPFLLSGAWVMGIGLHWIPFNPANLHMPGWGLAIFGLVFVCAGAAIASIAWARDPSFAKLMGAMMFIGVALIMHWVAFGTGERHFKETRRVHGVVVPSIALDEQSGRRVAGGVAIMLDLILGAAVLFRLRRDRRRTRR
jgi:hypothetical protein